jgi:hypothetical protein
MRWVAVALVLWIGMGAARAADLPSDVAAADRDAIQHVIQQQMDAFRHDNGPAAFAFASPGIQAQFGRDPENFMAMVRRGYQPVYRPRSTEFGPVTTEGGQVVQRVEVVGSDGVSREALYFMEHESDGSWRISGCLLTESSSVGA